MMHGMFGKCQRWMHSRSIGVLLLRVVLGAFFIAHGVTKFQNIEAMTVFFKSLGLSGFWVYVAASGEVLAGIGLVLGAFAWLAALIIVVDMVVAMVTVTAPNVGGQPVMVHFISAWGPNVIYAIAAVCVAFCGAGRYSLTGWWMRTHGVTCKDCKAGHGMGHECSDCSGHGDAPQEAVKADM